MSAPSVARLRITLDRVEPAVMRRVDVPLDLRLDRLHDTIQAAMGWTDSHLWGIEAGDLVFGPPMPDDGFGSPLADACKATLREVLEGTGRESIRYTYDHGDDWRHTIELERIGEGEPGVLYPRLVAAEGACPPEDIGGPPGYEAFLEAMADPDHEQHGEMIEWHGGPFDPNAVDAAAIEAALHRLARRWNRKPPARKPQSR